MKNNFISEKDDHRILKLEDPFEQIGDSRKKNNTNTNINSKHGHLKYRIYRQ